LAENQSSKSGTSFCSFEFRFFGFEFARTTIWWGEATDEPQSGQSFSLRLAGTLAPPVYTYAKTFVSFVPLWL
jgi:hypothetical protein